MRVKKVTDTNTLNERFKQLSAEKARRKQGLKSSMPIEGDTVVLAGMKFLIRKITKKDWVLRPLKCLFILIVLSGCSNPVVRYGDPVKLAAKCFEWEPKPKELHDGFCKRWDELRIYKPDAQVDANFQVEMRRGFIPE